jgi:hypothetical protein
MTSSQLLVTSLSCGRQSPVYVTAASATRSVSFQYHVYIDVFGKSVPAVWVSGAAVSSFAHNTSSYIVSELTKSSLTYPMPFWHHYYIAWLRPTQYTGQRSTITLILLYTCKHCVTTLCLHRYCVRPILIRYVWCNNTWLAFIYIGSLDNVLCLYWDLCNCFH